MNVENWINPKYLKTDSRFELERVPSVASLWVVDDFLVADVLPGLRQLFEYDGNWQDSYGLYIRGNRAEHVCTMEEWHAAPDDKRFWFYSVLKNQMTPGAPFGGWAHWFMFRRALESPTLFAALAKRTCRPITTSVSFNAIRLGYGQYLRPHSDNTDNRILCGAFYVTDGWQPGYGGEFEINTFGKLVNTVEPKTNRLILFDPRGQAGPESPNAEHRAPPHWILPLTEKAIDWKRGSISIWWARA